MTNAKTSTMTKKQRSATTTTHHLHADVVYINGQRDDAAAQRIARVSAQLAHDNERRAQRVARVNVTPRAFSIFKAE